MTTTENYLSYSRDLLRTLYLPKIRVAIQQMDEPDLWWKPNEASNSVGNLLMHLAGNVRQWMCHGIDGAPDVRKRATEFETNSGFTAHELLVVLSRAVDDACEVIDGLDDAKLQETRVIQGNAVTVLEAVYHVTHHFGMHAGQIMYISKLKTGTDLGLYQIQDGKAQPNWPGATIV